MSEPLEPGTLVVVTNSARPGEMAKIIGRRFSSEFPGLVLCDVQFLEDSTTAGGYVLGRDFEVWDLDPSDPESVERFLES